MPGTFDMPPPEKSAGRLNRISIVRLADTVGDFRPGRGRVARRLRWLAQKLKKRGDVRALRVHRHADGCNQRDDDDVANKPAIGPQLANAARRALLLLARERVLR